MAPATSGRGSRRSPVPPRRTERLLAGVLPAGVVGDTILGDLHQEFDERVAARGPLRARLWYLAVAGELAFRYRMRALRDRVPYRFHRDDSPRSHPMSDLLSDLRYGFRMLRKTPLVSAAAILAIAVGVGMTVHTFSIVYGSVIRGLPLPGNERLVQVRTANLDTGTRGMYVPFPDYLEVREKSGAFEWVASMYETNVNLAGEGGPPERYRGAVVSANALARLGVAPELGRVFVQGEDRAGADPVVVISHDVWKTRFGGDPTVVGDPIRANGELATIVGVMPEGFRFPFDQDIWMPDRRTAAERARHDGQWVGVFGHLRPGVGLEAASTELATLFEGLQTTHAEGHARLTAYTIHYEDAYMPSWVTLPLKLQLLAVLGVLLVACANVANLLLARSSVRTREVAVRSALGASRWRIVRQLLLETLALALVGGTLGIGLARVLLGTFNAAFAQIQRPYWIDMRLDGPALAVALLATLAAALVSGLLPALRATGRTDAGTLREDGRGSSLRLGRLSRGLVIAEVAVSAALLVMAGLMVKSIINANNVDLGFRTGDVLSARVALSDTDYPDAGARARFARQLLTELRDSPAIRFAALARTTPGLGAMRLVTAIEGETYGSQADYPLLNATVVSDGYFEALDVEPSRGRTFVPADSLDDAEPVAVVSESLARRFFPDGAIDRHLRVGGDGSPNPWMRIVGVVPDVYIGGGVGGLGDDRLDPATYYVPVGRLYARAYTLLVRGPMAPEELAPTIRAAVAHIDRDMPLYEVAPLAQAIESATWAFDMFGSLFGSLGLVALILAAVGLYGVMAFTVAQRTREVGIHMALGAEGRDVLWLMLGRGARQLAIGLAVGLAAGALLSRPLAAVTFDVSPGDPGVYVAIFLLLTVTGLVATLLPARRATRVDPSEALRLD